MTLLPAAPSGVSLQITGFKYTGVDIRQEQIDSNREQGLKLLPVNNQLNRYVGDSNIVLKDFNGNVIANKGTGEHTPIEKHDN